MYSIAPTFINFILFFACTHANLDQCVVIIMTATSSENIMALYLQQFFLLSVLLKKCTTGIVNVNPT